MLRNATACVMLAVALLLGGYTSAQAQAMNYTYSATAGTYSEISGGTVHATGTGIEGFDASAPIGFTFNFGGVNYTSVNVNGFGYLTFGGGTGYTTDPFNAVSWYGLNGAVSAWGNYITGTPTGELRTQVLGNSPNRTFVAQWRNVTRTSQGSSNDVYNFQIRLSEGSNRIDIVYGNMTVTAAVGAQVGVRFNGEDPVNIMSHPYMNAGWDKPHYTRSFVPSRAIENWAAPTGQTYSLIRRVAPGSNNDAAIINVENVGSYFNANTSQEIKVRVKNFGTNNLDSVTLNWTINGTAKTPVKYYPQPALAPGAEATITVGFHTFGPASFNRIRVWTAAPNGGTDVVPGNDSYEGFLAPRVAGTLNISQASGNPGIFNTIFTAVRHIVVSGVSGNTTFNIYDGTYDEQVILPRIDDNGTGARITFQSAPNNMPVLTHARTNYTSWNYGPFEASYSHFIMEGARNITINGLMFEQPAATPYGSFIYAEQDYNYSGNNVSGIQITNNTFEGLADLNQSYNNTDWAVTVFSYETGSNVIDNNSFVNYAYGPYLYAWGLPNNSVSNNTITDCSQGIQWYGNGVVAGNVISSSPSVTYFRGGYIQGENLTVEGNQVSGLQTSGTVEGIYVYSTSGTATLTNNMVAVGSSSGNVYGIVADASNGNVNLYHNTVNVTGTTGANSAALMAYTQVNNTPSRVRLINNILHNFGTGANGGYAIRINDFGSGSINATTSNPLAVSDFNNLMTTGVNVVNWDGVNVPRNTVGNPLTTWRASSLRDQNSASVAVTFVGGSDLHLLNIQQPLWGTTQTLNMVPTDIDGELRVKPYMGADEVRPTIRIVQQPESRYACLGESFTFVTIADVTPGATVTYQWQKDGNDLIGQTNAILSISNVGYNASGVYTCKVLASDGTTETELVSDEATLIVVRNTEITVQPASQPVGLGQTVNLEVQAEAVGSPSDFVAGFQWKKRRWDANSVSYVLTNIVDNGRITGSTSNVLTIRDVAASDTMDTYVCVVTGYCGTVESRPARLFIPAIVASLNTPTTCVGGDIQFEVATYPSASSSSPVEYQWYKDGARLSDDTRTTGSNAKVLTVTGATAADAGEYWVEVTYVAAGISINSSVTDVTVSVAPALTAQPSSDTVCVGEAVTMTVAATGDNLSYVWMKGTTAIPGQTTNTLTIASATAADAGAYTVTVSNGCATETSEVATLTVDEPPTVTTDPTDVSIAEPASFTLSISATGSGLVTYQWYRNDTAIAGATDDEYTVTTSTVQDAGSYWCVVTNACGQDTSAVATVGVTTGVTGDVVAGGFVLGTAWPNPTNDAVRVTYTVPSSVRVRMTLTDMTGRVLATLADEQREAGTYPVDFSASALGLNAGVYNVTIQAGRFVGTQQVIVIR